MPCALASLVNYLRIKAGIAADRSSVSAVLACRKTTANAKKEKKSKEERKNVILEGAV